MPEILVVSKFQKITGVPADDASMTWAFDAADLQEATLDGITDSIISWFNTDVGQFLAMSEYMSGALQRGAGTAELAVYDISGSLGGGPFGAPVYVRPFSLLTASLPSGAVNFPGEVAIRHTVLAANWADVPETAPNPSPPPATIRPRSRYRGGFYHGPLTSRTHEMQSGMVTVAGFYKTAAGVAWNRFLDERPDFGIWSRRDAVVRPVVAGAPDAGQVSIDNAFDTIRRRGRVPTSRTVVWP